MRRSGPAARGEALLIRDPATRQTGEGRIEAAVGPTWLPCEVSGRFARVSTVDGV